MSLLTPQIVKNTHILTGNYFIFLKKRPGPNLKVFLNQIWKSVKRLEKSYQYEKIYHFLTTRCSTFMLKLC